MVTTYSQWAAATQCADPAADGGDSGRRVDSPVPAGGGGGVSRHCPVRRQRGRPAERQSRLSAGARCRPPCGGLRASRWAATPATPPPAPCRSSIPSWTSSPTRRPTSPWPSSSGSSLPTRTSPRGTTRRCRDSTSEAKMCQFSNLWRSFTCGYLLHLLTVEYPNSNLPQVIRQVPDQGGGEQQLSRPILQLHRRGLLEAGAADDAADFR